MGEMRNAHRILVGKPEANAALGKPRCIREDNIKMGLKEIGRVGVDCVDMAHDKANDALL
jgi:hypothetical protein